VKLGKSKVHVVDKANDTDTAPCQSAIPLSLIGDALDRNEPGIQLALSHR